MPVLLPDYDLVACTDGTTRRVKPFLPRMDQDNNWEPGQLAFGDVEDVEVPFVDQSDPEVVPITEE